MRRESHHDPTDDALGGARGSWPGLAVAAGAFLSVTLIGGSGGGYYPDAWGWIVLGFGWMAALALVLRRRISLGPFEIATCAALALLTAWIGASIAWSDDVPQSVFELERALVYLVGLGTVLVAVRRRSLTWFVGGLLAGIAAVCVVALLSRLFPSEGVGSEEILLNRLSDPIGYWNALGIFAGMGALIALGVAAHAERVGARVAAAAAMPVLLTTLYFTYSRGSWIALAIGAVAAVAVDPRRLGLVTTGLLLAPASAIAVAISASSEALTRLRAPHDQIVDDGRQLALVLLALVVLSAGIALATSMAGKRVRIRPAVRRAYGGVLAGITAVAVVVALVQLGGPVKMVEDAYSSFKDENPAPASPGATRAGDLNQRLFTLRSNGRIDYWQASWDQNQARPLLGQGAGSFEQYWLRERPFPSQIRDAHGLYAEWLGEVGWIGLGLLVLVLGLALLAGLGARADRVAPGAFGALIAYVAHAGVDWDWEVPAVTLVALSCGAVLLISARGARRLALGAPARVAMLVALVAIAAFSSVGLLGNRALVKAEAAADAARWTDAARDARTAKRWAPWSGAAWRDLGRAQLGLGQRREARASLLKATRKDPRDWRGWYYLGSASRGRERLRAYRRAARLNLFAKDIEPLRKRYRLPKAPEPTR